MSATLTPAPFLRFADDDNLPFSGGFLYVKLAGTDTDVTVYTDAAMTVPHTDPIELDAGGCCTIYLPVGSYKYILHDANDDFVDEWDYISSISLGQSNIGEVFTFGGNSAEPISQTTYPSGVTFDKFHGGTAIWSIDSASLVGNYELAGMLMAPAGQTITAALVCIDDPDTPIATMTSSDTLGERVQSGGITFPAPGLARTYGVKVRVSGGVGFAWGFSIVRTS